MHVVWSAAPFGSKDLSDIYRRAPGLKQVLDGTGGFKRFCNSFPDKLSFDGAVLRRAPEWPFSRVAELILEGVERHGGCVMVSELYEEHPGLEKAMGEHGGPVAVCAKASMPPPWLAVTRGQIRTVSDVAPLPSLSVRRPNVAEQDATARLLDAIRQVGRTLGHGAADAEAYVFGSSANGFGESSSDVDVVLEVPPAVVKHFAGADGVLRAFKNKLPREGELVVVGGPFQCRVPVLKLKFGDMECDLCANNFLPLFNTALLAEYAALDARLVPLVKEVKSWAKLQGVHGAPSGYLSSYAFTLLVIFYAQRMGALPCLQLDLQPKLWVERGRAFNVAMRSGHQAVTNTEIELNLRGFARYFAHDVAWGEHVISVRAGALLSLVECPHLKSTSNRDWDPLHIEDPFDESRNLGDVMAQVQCARFREHLRRAAAALDSDAAEALVVDTKALSCDACRPWCDTGWRCHHILQ